MRKVRQRLSVFTRVVEPIVVELGLTQVGCLSHSTTALFKVARKLNLASSRMTSSLLLFLGHFQFKLSSKCPLSIPPPRMHTLPRGKASSPLSPFQIWACSGSQTPLRFAPRLPPSEGLLTWRTRPGSLCPAAVITTL